MCAVLVVPVVPRSDPRLNGERVLEQVHHLTPHHSVPATCTPGEGSAHSGSCYRYGAYLQVKYRSALA
jgi:hypothetical protein